MDAFFIGLSLGLQRRVRFAFLAAMNTFLAVLCALGFLLAERIYAHIPFNPDLVVGFSFIGLGAWCIASYFFSRRQGSQERESSPRTLIIIGIVMSFEAMLITMGITLIFGAQSTWAIPATVALAHFGYSAVSFALARTRHIKRIPALVSNVVSGLALITYGMMSLFV
jgi:putative Mn2+ efflux pump MntP